MYKLTNDTIIIRVADGAFIPAEPANRDFAAYVAWLEAGNAPEPVDMPSHNDVIDAQIASLESEHPITMRDYRETKLAMAMSAGLPAAWCDPEQPDPSELPQFKNLGFGLRIAVLQERGARALRAQRK